MITLALLADGHVLLEDVPGTGKTLLAGPSPGRWTSGSPASRARPTCSRPTSPAPACSRAAASGSSTGPVFTNVLLVDEINRATPRTQSALLEAMQERQVTVEGTTHPLPDPFLVLATQNPVEFEGTFALPQAQLDRFLLRAAWATRTATGERRIARRHQAAAEPLDAIEPVIDRRAPARGPRPRPDVRVSRRGRGVPRRDRSRDAEPPGHRPRRQPPRHRRPVPRRPGGGGARRRARS